MKRRKFEKEMLKLQAQLCHLQDWVKHKSLRVIIVFDEMRRPFSLSTLGL